MRIKLGEAERVIVKTRQHRRALNGPVCAFLLVVTATAFGAGWLGRDGLPPWLVDILPILLPSVLGLGALLAIGWSLVPYLRWSRTWYYLTNRRIVIRTGVGARSLRELPLVLIRELAVRQTMMQRSAGAGHLVMITANGETTLKNVPGVHKLRELVLDAIEELPRSVMFDGVELETEQQMDWAAPEGRTPDGMPHV
ncbi:PH domain-containing protein [Zhihengliuella salsuginis]|uniref:YdbS-like PH domain-containing protein n=1 Tax=Zhihengliuella salsuginis TaxID=578222 RepID=A0ABQ3GJQ5_9MICC|nr:PH domain-containing protein [Zhihengliuella salsuginis]GHD08073.1 hypothetical protein GCM10008096_19530 [Zhihengliuella salsuginis]